MGEVGVAVVVPRPGATGRPRDAPGLRRGAPRTPQAARGDAGGRRPPPHRRREGRPARAGPVDRTRRRRRIASAAMELDFDADQEDLRDSVRAFLAAECPIGLVRDLVEARIAGGTTTTDALQAQMAELGWPALTVPEPAGGLGLGTGRARTRRRGARPGPHAGAALRHAHPVRPDRGRARNPRAAGRAPRTGRGRIGERAPSRWPSRRVPSTRRRRRSSRPRRPGASRSAGAKVDGGGAHARRVDRRRGTDAGLRGRRGRRRRSSCRPTPP